MGEADNALRDEIEKVRERARLQALAQGLGPDAAVHQGNVAVEEFCARWGIRPEMVGPGVMGGARAVRDEARKVDLGASPMRNTANPGQTQAIRIADLLKRAKEAEGGPARAPAPPPAVAAPPRAVSNLSSLLQRMRTADSPQNPASTPPARPFTPAPVPAPAPSPARTASSLTGGGATLTVNAERRRQVLEEFDRTYAEVQAMLEQRIGVVDIALNDVSAGVSGVMAKAKAGGLQPQEMELLAADVDRLRQNLTVMMQLCDEFLHHMNQINVGRSSGR